MTNYNRPTIFITANKLTRQGYSRSQAFIIAWTLGKGQVTKVSGTAFHRRQEAIERLTRYFPDQVKFSLYREENNPYDSNAVAVMVRVNDSKPYKIGYVPAFLSRIMSSVLGIGSENGLKASIQAIVGGFYGNYYGLRLNLSL